MSEDITDQRFTDEAALRYFRRHFPGYDVEAPAAPGGQWRAAATGGGAVTTTPGRKGTGAAQESIP